MATIDASVGGAAANAFCTLTEANTIMADEIPNSVWTAASTDNRTRAIIAFARVMNDEVLWKGAATSTAQAMQLPRFGLVSPTGHIYSSDEIPDWAKRANALGAQYWLDQNRLAAQDAGDFSQVSIPGLSFQSRGSSGGIAAIPPEVRSILKFYARAISGSGMAKLVRT